MAPQEAEQLDSSQPQASPAAAGESLPAAAAREGAPPKEAEAKEPLAEAKEETKERKASIFDVFGRVSSMLTGGRGSGGGAKKVRTQGKCGVSDESVACLWVWSMSSKW